VRHGVHRCGDERAATHASAYQTFGSELFIAGHHCIAIDRKLLGKFARSRQRFAGF